MLTEPRLATAADPVEDPIYIGSVDATQHGLSGALRLNVRLAVDGSSLELGPYHIPRDALRRLTHVFLIIHALIDHDQPATPAREPK